MTKFRRIIIALIIVCGVITWSACSSDGYTPGTSTVYVGHGYGGYGPGWGHGWGGYGGYGGPGRMGPPIGMRY